MPSLDETIQCFWFMVTTDICGMNHKLSCQEPLNRFKCDVVKVLLIPVLCRGVGTLVQFCQLTWSLQL